MQFHQNSETAEVIHPATTDAGERLIPRGAIAFKTTIEIATHPEDDELIDPVRCRLLFEKFYGKLKAAAAELVDEYKTLIP